MKLEKRSQISLFDPTIILIYINDLPINKYKWGDRATSQKQDEDKLEPDLSSCLALTQKWEKTGL